MPILAEQAQQEEAIVQMLAAETKHAVGCGALRMVAQVTDYARYPG